MYNTYRVYQMHTNTSFIIVYITAGSCQEYMEILLVTFPVPFINFKCAFISRKHYFPIIKCTVIIICKNYEFDVLQIFMK